MGETGFKKEKCGEGNVGIVCSNFHGENAVVDRGGNEAISFKDLDEEEVPIASCVFLALDVAESSEDIIFGFAREMFAMGLKEPFEVKGRA